MITGCRQDVSFYTFYDELWNAENTTSEEYFWKVARELANRHSESLRRWALPTGMNSYVIS